jgi:hypothetical protein
LQLADACAELFPAVRDALALLAQAKAARRQARLKSRPAPLR